ncbi:PREDICTED: uncharacterized protein LOC104609488 [Nelumbo nucifera]|uniref:Uncharacterized protein LOC104609488 n=2 Tax=Nelumbo nucifera TaxID=4432 RepID=A0A1U8BCW6_NELNU|nr:PREDICTED: uncharacterized protein LOC104609488 [Nelumbo nucifera]DAD43703.1 TPA_asm: hypothetical protein HUJ06_001933 [Nelumbo nucifera]
MGMVVVVSLPLILFSIMLGFGCYFLGRARGRQDVRTCPQIYGEPVPPPGGVASFPSPPTTFTKKPDNLNNV